MGSTRATMLLVSIVGAAGCDASGLDASEANDVFAHGTDLIHALHGEAGAMPAWPASHTFACPDGGHVAMTSGADTGGAVPQDLAHTFEGCGVDGWTLDGDLDYLNISFCDDTSPTFEIVGTFVIAGHGTCTTDAQETCGVITGTTCGVAQ